MLLTPRLQAVQMAPYLRPAHSTSAIAVLLSRADTTTQDKWFRALVFT